MDDLEGWMKKYINKRRLKFVDNMCTQLFIEGFPRLHDSIKERARCYLRQEGFFQANSLLLDSIVKIDDFPRYFIKFCKEHDINHDLKRIIEAGIDEFNSKYGSRQVHQDQQYLVGNRNRQHRGHLLPLTSDNGNDSASSHNQVVLEALTPIEDHRAGVEAVNIVTAVNYMNQDENERSALNGISQEILPGVISKDNAECLISPLEGTVDNSLICTDNSEVNNLSAAVLEIPCPCPHHTTLGNIACNNFQVDSTGEDHEHKVYSSVSENFQGNENKLHSTTSGIQKGKPYYEEKIIKVPQRGHKNARNNVSVGSVGSESWESYYLSSSDEEDLLPAQNVAHLQIENLKEVPKQLSNAVESEQEFHSPGVEGSAIFDKAGFSGIECQEDIEKYKNKVHTEETTEKSKKNVGAKSVNKPVNDKQSEYINYELEDNHNTVAKFIDSEDSADNNKASTYVSYVTDHIGSFSSTDSYSSETELKDINEMNEVVAQQQTHDENQTQYNPDDFHTLHAPMGVSNLTESYSDQTLIHPLSVNDPSSSADTNTSQGFELHVSFAHDVGHSDLNSVHELSDIVSEDIQSWQTKKEDSALFNENDCSNQSLIASELSAEQSSENIFFEVMQNNNPVPPQGNMFNYTLTLVKIIMETYFPEFCIRF